MKNSVKTCLAAAAVSALAGACTHHTVETSSEVKPIHIVIDINVKIDKDLDKYFGEDAGAKGEVQKQTAQAATEAGKEAVKQVLQISLEEALKPVTLETLPAREVMMGRFDARRPLVKELKAKGVVGEDARGYLQFVEGKKESEELVSAENSDRKVIYERISKRQGTSAEKVAAVKAEKNAKEALPGEFVQDASGKWSKKD